MAIREVGGMKNRFRSIRVLMTISMVLMFVAVFLTPEVSASSSAVYSKGSTSSKMVAFTFDDGDPLSDIAPVLSILKANGIKATFFFTGEMAAKYPDSIRAIYNAGHEVGNHSYYHTDFTTLSYSGIQSELSRTDNVISGITGETTKPMFRPAYGSYNSTVLQAAGDAGYAKTIMWTIDSQDYNGLSAGQIYTRVINNVTPGAIILMHTGDNNSVYALQDIISTLRSWGYGFTTVSGILGGGSGGTASGSTLRLGSTGTGVMQLQQALANKGYSLAVDGSFGPITQNAVISFQRSVGITADGIVGPVTWSKLGTSSGTISSGSTAYPGLLKIGSSGTSVRTLQQALANKGYSLSIDGVFGPITQNTVMSFQRSQGITVDGIVGPVTWGKLF
ncbi:MAG: polysaccharide deacetylase [Firmicutes bacterium]|nr:polysaccharide deacetylase [Bacillota bacterium]